MKYLFLLLILACGHEAPESKDVSDSDGDHIPNFLEVSDGLQKYLASVNSYGEIEGEVLFRTDHRRTSVKFSNKKDLTKKAMRLLTRSIHYIKDEVHFSEWSDLQTQGPNDFNLTEDSYLVSFNFHTEEKPKFITFIKDGVAKIKRDYSPNLEVNLTRDDLIDLINNRLTMRLTSQEENIPATQEVNIKEKTYRIYRHQDGQTIIHYVSKELSLEDYMRLTGIKNTIEAKSINSFSLIDDRLNWWIRKINENDIILVQSSLSDISEFHRLNFEKTDHTIQRTNGSSTASLEVNKEPMGKFILRIQGFKEVRAFKESTRSWRIGGARGEISESCREWSRVISQTDKIDLSFQDITNNLEIRSEGKLIDMNAFDFEIEEMDSPEGRWIEIAFPSTPESFTVSLTNLPQDSFTVTGEYKKQCTHEHNPRFGGIKTNNEGQMQLKVESYIEKMD